jgi:hypothetical protein
MRNEAHIDSRHRMQLQQSVRRSGERGQGQDMYERAAKGY